MCSLSLPHPRPELRVFSQKSSLENPFAGTYSFFHLVYHISIDLASGVHWTPKCSHCSTGIGSWDTNGGFLLKKEIKERREELLKE